ncbi:unnamed protein product [Arabidopsis arenosa]|uniref:Uncharacterized protein n=1 Tax=Arabidopsis arenosa TaxID=38785 RepID=A0A8S2APZ9_ARAAE|nr:unnamed protein product [Arabidopsis arenosa]
MEVPSTLWKGKTASLLPVIRGMVCNYKPSLPIICESIRSTINSSSDFPVSLLMSKHCTNDSYFVISYISLGKKET